MSYAPADPIEFVSQSLPSKIKARFPSPHPVSVTVDGSNDNSKVANGGNSGFGNWISKEKYDTLQLTLLFLDANGNMANKQDYDANGKPIVVPPPADCNADCFFANVESASSARVEIHFIMNTETIGNKYQLQRSADNNSFTDVQGTAASTLANGSNDHTLSDLAPLGGTSYYRIKLCCNAGCTSNDTFTGSSPSDQLMVQL